MNLAMWMYLAVFAAGVMLFACYARIGKLWRCVFFTGFSGIGALGIVLLAGKAAAVKLALTPLTLLISVLMGIPGVIGMLILNLI